MSFYQEEEEFKGEPVWMERESKEPDDIYVLSLWDEEICQLRLTTVSSAEKAEQQKAELARLQEAERRRQTDSLAKAAKLEQSAEDEAIALSLRDQEERQQWQSVEDAAIALSLQYQEERQQWQSVEDAAIALSLHYNF